MTAESKANRRPDPFDRPLDATLERLRVHSLAYRPHFDLVDAWLATCPIDGEELLLHEPYVGAAVTILCAGGCHESRIVHGLAAEPSYSSIQGLDLAEDVSSIAHRALELVESLCR